MILQKSVVLAQCTSLAAACFFTAGSLFDGPLYSARGIEHADSQANAAAEPVHAEFSPPDVSSGDVLFEDRGVALTDGKLVDSFDVHGVLVYRFM